VHPTAAPLPKLTALLIEDPPVRYARSNATPDIPADSIRTRRRRCRANCASHPAIAALTNADLESARLTRQGP